MLEEARAITRTDTYVSLTPTVLCLLAGVVREQGYLEEALHVAEEAVEFSKAHDFTMQISDAATQLGEVQHRLGRTDLARAAWEEALADRIP